MLSREGSSSGLEIDSARTKLGYLAIVVEVKRVLVIVGFDLLKLRMKGYHVFKVVNQGIVLVDTA